MVTVELAGPASVRFRAGMVALALPAPNDPRALSPHEGEALLARDLFAPWFTGLAVELVLAAGFDSAGRLLGFHGEYGEQDANPALPACVRAALRHPRVEWVIVAHNHVIGDSRPSPADRAATRRMTTLCRLAGARLHDHLIFTSDTHFSFRACGLV